jgi:hypothetical protein
MNNLEQYYRNLCEQLQAQVDLLEKKIEEKKKAKKQVKGKKPAKDKMADKDYDGDGTVETGKEEYFGSRDKAIKKNMKKKKTLKEGRVVGDGQFLYGGFPRVLNEMEIRLAKGNANPDEESEYAEAPDTNATDEFNDGDDGPGEPSVATQSDSEEESLQAMEKRHAEMMAANIGIERDYDEPGERRGLGFIAREKLYGPAKALRAKIEAHPEFIARQNAMMPKQR